MKSEDDDIKEANDEELKSFKEGVEKAVEDKKQQDQKADQEKKK
jgi:hypothetical protein